MDKSDCWTLYFEVLKKLEELCGQITFSKGCGGDIVDAIYKKAKELGL